METTTRAISHIVRWPNAVVMAVAVSMCACQSLPHHAEEHPIFDSAQDESGKADDIAQVAAVDIAPEPVKMSISSTTNYAAGRAGPRHHRAERGNGPPNFPPTLPASPMFAPLAQPACAHADGAACQTSCGCGPWRDQRPWPGDEYICDGGDANGQVVVTHDSTVYGLNQEDTVAHYNTQDGLVRVQPSNRVCIYAPRFAAVRKVYGTLQHEQHQRSAGVELPVMPGLSGQAELATTAVQPEQPVGQRSVKFGQTFRERLRTVGAENLTALAGTEAALLPFEDFLKLRRHEIENTEKPRLTQRLEAAITWTHDAAVQVVIDNVEAVEVAGNTRPQSLYTFEMPPGKPRLCLVKCASTKDALPGDTVEFMIRFENIGDQTIENVTIVDNLSSRLEYVADSQECTPEAEFSTEENEGESLVLSWQLAQPLEFGANGAIRFRCRVR